MMELSAPVRAFLEKPNLAVLVTVGPRGGPQATPVWFLVEDGRMVNTSRGRVKLRNVRANPEVVLTIVDRDNPYHYVQIFGRVTEIDPARGARDIDRLSLRYRGKPYTYPPSDRPEWRHTILIAPQRIDAHLR